MSRFLSQIAEHSRRQPNAIAFSELADGETVSAQLTFAEIESQSNAFAHSLTEAQAKGQTLVFAFKSSTKFLIAFLGALKAGVTPVPVPLEGGKTSRDRRGAVISALRAERVLTDSAEALSGDLNSTQILEFDTLQSDAAAAEYFSQPDWGAPALLQFSSGSTGAPKGICITHGNLDANLEQMRRDYEYGPEANYVSWLPLFHDMGLMGGLLAPLYFGRPNFNIPTSAFFRKPIRWLQLISRLGDVVSGGPCSAFSLCARLVKDQHLSDLDLTNWKVAYCGAEPIRAPVLERFTIKFSPAGFSESALLPCYGLAEATLLVTSGRYQKSVLEGDGTETARVSCGPPTNDIAIEILDDTNQPTDGLGRICLSGPNISTSYWSAEDKRFQETPIVSVPGHAQDYFDTGDIGTLVDGNLFVVDRLKDVIIINGRNIHAVDLEQIVFDWFLDNKPDFREFDCVAFTVEESQTERAVILCEVALRNGIESELPAIRTGLSRAVFSAYQISPLVDFVRRGRLQRTSSGKIKRQGNRRAYQDGDLALLHLSSDSEG